MQITLRAATDVGRRRPHNEDSFVLDTDLGLALVADGMGGHAAGEVASRMAADAFRKRLHEGSEVLESFAAGNAAVSVAAVTELMRSSMAAANETVHREGQSNTARRGMGTTCTAALVVGERVFVAHVGDSRAYLVRAGEACQLTTDHSLLNQLVRLGRLSAEEAASGTFGPYRNALSRAIGVDSTVECDVFTIEVLHGDVIIVASDGLTHYLDCEEFALIASRDIVIEDEFVRLANERGGHDNITAATIRLTASDEELEREARRIDEFARKSSAFRDVALFRALDEAQLLHLLGSAHESHHDAGSVVVREGDLSPGMFAILSGALCITSQGEEVTLLGPGDHFGALSLVDDEPSGISATVTEPVRLVSLSRVGLEALVERSPDLGSQLLWSLAGTVEQRVARREAADEAAHRRAVGKSD